MKKFLKKIWYKIKCPSLNWKQVSTIFNIGRCTTIEVSKNSNFKIDKQVSFNDFVKVIVKYNSTLNIGKNVHIGDYTLLSAAGGDIFIGDDSMIAQGVKLITTNHAFKNKDILIREQGIDENKKGIIIGKDCWIAAGVIILPGVTINDGVVVAANSVVTKSFPSYSVLAGVPAKVIGYRN